MNEKIVDKIGWFASFMAVAMYFSYIDQIRLNISGQPGSIVLPIITTINCTAWTLYGILKIKRDWPIIIANIPGIILGITTAITAII
ncbi:MAG: SemiSWEET family transporter [Candidatus Magasanikiibacteriota bacterium]